MNGKNWKLFMKQISVSKLSRSRGVMGINMGGKMKRLKERRLELSISQEDLGKSVGVTRLTIINLETKKRDASCSLGLKIANYLGVSVEWLCGNEGFELFDVKTEALYQKFKIRFMKDLSHVKSGKKKLESK